MGLRTLAIIVSFLILCGGAGLFFHAIAKKRGSAIRGIGAVITLIAIAMLISLPSSIYIINTGEVGVVRYLGEAREVLTPGPHVRLWFTHTVDRYDIRTREITDIFEAYSRDAQVVSGILTVQYNIQPDNALSIARQYGTVEILEQRIRATIVERAKSVFSDKGAMVIVETRAGLSSEVEARIRPMLVPYMIDMTLCALEDISFSSAFEDAVEEKMQAEQAQLRAEYDRERALIIADQQLEVSKKEAEAVIERARGDAEALRIMQGAWGSLALEVRDAMLRQLFYESWDGVMPRTYVEGGGTSGGIDSLILNPLEKSLTIYASIGILAKK
jgi:regulator of protease activity HflC (stomatin/prohibitin superfamily)